MFKVKSTNNEINVVHLCVCTMYVYKYKYHHIYFIQIVMHIIYIILKTNKIAK